MDHSFNSKHQLYLNILYDIIKVGIGNGSSLVDFARTAPEIKSSVGAIPRETYFFLRHKNGLLNKIVPRVVDSLQSKDEIVYRSPFKDKATTPQPKKSGKAPKAASNGGTQSGS